MESIGSCCRGFGNCIGTILRVILFIMCALLMLTSVMNICSYIFLSEEIKELVPIAAPTFGTYLRQIFMFLLALVGCHGTFTGSAQHLKWFAFWLAIFATIHLTITLIAFRSQDIEKLEDEISKPLIEFAKKFQMEPKANEKVNNATIVWNVLQAAFDCCGLKNADDWHEWRSDIKKDEYPQSCCHNHDEFFDTRNPARGICRKPLVTERGCLPILGSLVAVSFLLYVLSFVYYLLMSAIALVVAKHLEPGTSLLPFKHQKFTNAY